MPRDYAKAGVRRWYVTFRAFEWNTEELEAREVVYSTNAYHKAMRAKRFFAAIYGDISGTAQTHDWVYEVDSHVSAHDDNYE